MRKTITFLLLLVFVLTFPLAVSAEERNAQSDTVSFVHQISEKPELLYDEGFLEQFGISEEDGIVLIYPDDETSFPTRVVKNPSLTDVLENVKSDFEEYNNLNANVEDSIVSPLAFGIGVLKCKASGKDQVCDWTITYIGDVISSAYLYLDYIYEDGDLLIPAGSDYFNMIFNPAKSTIGSQGSETQVWSGSYYAELYGTTYGRDASYTVATIKSAKITIK